MSLGVLVSCSVTTTSPPVARESAAHEAQSSIVEAQTTDVAAEAVLAAGGQVNSRLNIIDAVEAKLTDAQRQQVLGSPGVKQISVNTLVTTEAAAYVKDSFEVDSFANNDGTHRWYGNWVEQNDDNNPDGGYIMIGWLDHGGKRMILTGRGASIYRKAATPSSSPTVTLNFKYQRN